jgi:prephenate dehydrogenase
MWAELFVENADHLTKDIESLIREMRKLQAAIAARDEKLTRQLLADGSAIKESLDNKTS